MIWILVIITFVFLVLMTLCKDSWLNRELHIYNKVSTKPYLKRTFITDTYNTFTE